jgi:hypothetical protein
MTYRTTDDALSELAAENQRFRARIEELEKALKPFAGAYDYYKLWHPALLEDESASCMEYGHATIGHLRTAARALKGEG